jgi:uncharacterized membrane protein YtjA (UPF0391 family)
MVIRSMGFNPQEVRMFFMWAAVFFLIALVAGVFGFTDIAADASEVARILFYISLAIFLLLLTSGVLLYRKVTSFARGLSLNDHWKGLLRRMK